MTLVIELEQCFHSIAQMERRGPSSGLSLSNEWCFHKQEFLPSSCDLGLPFDWIRKCVRRWLKKKRASEDGRTAMTMYKSADARDFLKPQAMMTVLIAPRASAAEAPLRRKERPVHLTPGGVGMLSSTKRSRSHSEMMPESLKHDGESSARDQYKTVSR
jgi:hypothetical protein